MDKLTEPEAKTMASASSKLSRLPLYINRKPYATVDDIGALARKVRGLKLIVVDYIGKITPSRGGRGRTASST